MTSSQTDLRSWGFWSPDKLCGAHIDIQPNPASYRFCVTKTNNFRQLKKFSLYQSTVALCSSSSPSFCLLLDNDLTINQLISKLVLIALLTNHSNSIIRFWQLSAILRQAKTPSLQCIHSIFFNGFHLFSCLCAVHVVMCSQLTPKQSCSFFGSARCGCTRLHLI